TRSSASWMAGDSPTMPVICRSRRRSTSRLPTSATSPTSIGLTKSSWTPSRCRASGTASCGESASPMIGRRSYSSASLTSRRARRSSRPPVRTRSAGSATSAIDSDEVSSSTRKPSFWNASLSRTAGSRSCVVMRTVSAIVQLVTLGIGAAEQLYRVLEERLEHGQSVADAVQAPRQIDDEGAAADPGDAAREPGVRRRGGAPGADRLGNARRIPLEDRARRFRRDVAFGEAGAARGDDDIGDVAVGPRGESRGDLGGVIGYNGVGGGHVTAPDRPLGDGVAAPIFARPPRDSVRDGENGQAYRVHARLLPR